MSYTINTNINSLNAQRNAGMNSSSLSVSMQRLSSGLRINSAKDDAAGFLQYLIDAAGRRSVTHGRS